MNDRECVEFLQWALPRLKMRWPGFRRVRRQVRRRVNARMAELGLDETSAYRAHLENHAQEWAVLDGLCRVTISRFLRNRGVFAFLFETVLPALGERAGSLRAWSLGSASGEEAYTLSIGWALTPHAPCELEILGTDADPHMVERARVGRYPESSLRELPPRWRDEAFEAVGGGYRLRDRYRRGVTFRCEDVRETMPDGPFDLILCRNLAFTYYYEELQLRVARALAQRLATGGALVLGHHETLPSEVAGFEPWRAHEGVYRRVDA